MLSLLKIKNVALIDELELEFAAGLNLLTGETGSGKSIIVDSLSALTGERISSDLVKEGETSARIEGLFNVAADERLVVEFEESGVDFETELIVRRELSLTGKNRIFINNQLVTQSFLRKIGAFLVDIHGQGEQATLFDPATHLEMLDEFAGVRDLKTATAESFLRFRAVRRELDSLRDDEAHKLQLLDILRFQVDEIGSARLTAGEDVTLDEEKRRLNNVEKLSGLSEEAYLLLYENEEATLTTLEKVARRVDELARFDARFAEYSEGLGNAQAVLEDLAFTVRDFRGALEFSPERLAEIDDRLAEISRLKRKYGGSVETVLAHFEESSERLRNIETAELRESELKRELAAARDRYVETAGRLHDKRTKCAARMAKEIETNLKAVSLEKARFEVRVDADTDDDRSFGAKGFDRVEFFFSANPGESVKPIGKVASGGELSRLMLILNTTAKLSGESKTMVFDEIDSGIGGRVAEAVGLKLKELARTQQVLCVTHQPQVASLADHHFVVSKAINGKTTRVGVRELGPNEKIEELARMLAGETITETARQHAREMLAGR
ncbi:MAG: DNA repair protein RecN [Acidobacteria bacterium]|nr:DNA repair protein RecN [Acidobacteriota bacterium]